MGKTKIQWCDDGIRKPETWNPITGCTPISPGCDHCYAKRIADRFHEGDFGVTIHKKRIHQPDHWKRLRRTFVCSVSDLFHRNVPDSTILEIFDVMRCNHNHIFMILTKRAKRMMNFWYRYKLPRMAKNVWLGVSVENQYFAHKRIPYLLECRFAAMKFVSFEPLLEPVHILSGDMNEIDWIIAGGESGPNGRPMHPDWIHAIREQCAISHTPFFFKQWGEWMPREGIAMDGNLINPACGVFENATHPFGIDGPCMWRRRFMQSETNPNDNLDGKQYHEFPEVKS